MERRPSAGESVAFTVAPEEAGWRLDLFLAHRLPDYSRVHLRRVITAGVVEIDGCFGGKPSHRLRVGQQVALVLPEMPRQTPRPEEIPIEVLYEDEELAVVNKPPGMVVHPARGHWQGTLAAAVSHRFQGQLSSAGGPSRPGIVHRLDRDTSGAILVAKHDLAHTRLAEQFAARTVEKEYYVLVAGSPRLDRDVIDEPIGLHPHQRERMAIRRGDPESRPAQTYYEILERFVGFAAVKAIPKTGRTHQIRVHLAHAGCPVLCDRHYGGRAEITLGELRREPPDANVLLRRQALHALRLRLLHPATGAPLVVEAPLPADMAAAVEALRRYRSAAD